MSTYAELGFDFDGTLADSRSKAFAAAEGIGSLFDLYRPVSTMDEYRRIFAEIEHLYAGESESAEALRVLHRLVMRACADMVPIFDEVVSIAESAVVPVVVISSALHATVQRGLHGRLDGVRTWCHEDGLKEANLASWTAGRLCLYVTDNIRDIQRCRDSGVDVVAVTWGFDGADGLRHARPDYFAESPDQLKQILKTLNLI